MKIWIVLQLLVLIGFSTTTAWADLQIDGIVPKSSCEEIGGTVETMMISDQYNQTIEICKYYDDVFRILNLQDIGCTGAITYHEDPKTKEVYTFTHGCGPPHYCNIEKNPRQDTSTSQTTLNLSNDKQYEITMLTNSSMCHVDEFIPHEKKLVSTLTGNIGIPETIYYTIPTEIMSGDFTVIVDGDIVPLEIIENDRIPDMIMVHLDFNETEHATVEIISTQALPDLFPERLSPLKQVKLGFLPNEFVCKSGLELVFKSFDGSPACVKVETREKLVERGWILFESLDVRFFTDKNPVVLSDSTKVTTQFTNQIQCVTDYSNKTYVKFDSGLLKKINAIIDTDVIREYPIILGVADKNKEKVEMLLQDCHGASNVFKAETLSIVYADVLIHEIPKLADYSIIGKVGAGGLFEIPAKLEKIEGKTWVEIDPIQCMGNPWESDWRANSRDGSLLYGHLKEEEKSEIIQNYYAKNNIVIFDVKTAITYEAVCEGCSCPNGYTLYLLVSDDAVEQMLDLGYILSDT